MSRFRKAIAPLAAVLALMPGLVNAQSQQPPPPGYGMGPGIMGGPGMAGGMMGGGPGPGMMGGGMMMGPGGGPAYGMGPGVGGYGAGAIVSALNLTEAQRADVNKIRDDLRRKNWDLLGKMQDQAAMLRDLYGADKLDRGAITAAYKRVGDLRLQRIENFLDAAEKIQSVLTPQQRDQLKRHGPWWMREISP